MAPLEVEAAAGRIALSLSLALILELLGVQLPELAVMVVLVLSAMLAMQGHELAETFAFYALLAPIAMLGQEYAFLALREA